MKCGGWRDGPVVKRTSCSSRGPQCDFQHPHGSLQPSVTPASGDRTHPLSSTGCCTCIHSGTHLEIKNKYFKIKYHILLYTAYQKIAHLPKSCQWSKLPQSSLLSSVLAIIMLVRDIATWNLQYFKLWFKKISLCEGLFKRPKFL